MAERFTKDELVLLISESVTALMKSTIDKIDNDIRQKAFDGATLTNIPRKDLNLADAWLQIVLDGYTARGFTASQDSQYIVIKWS